MYAHPAERSSSYLAAIRSFSSLPTILDDLDLGIRRFIMTTADYVRIQAQLGDAD